MFVFCEEFKVSLFVDRRERNEGAECYSVLGAKEGSLDAGLNLGAPSSAARYAPAAGQPSAGSTRSYSAAALRGSALTDPDTSARPAPRRDRRPTAATKLGFMSL
jgi:hypothetical protein